MQRVRSGDLNVVLLSEDGTLNRGKDAFVIEFRKPDGSLVDVGTVTTSANMPMPGMTMAGSVQVERSDVPGRYRANGDFGMAGGWQMKSRMERTRGPGCGELRGNRAMTRGMRVGVAPQRSPRRDSYGHRRSLRGEALTLGQAVASSLSREPSLRAATADLEALQGMSASGRPSRESDSVIRAASGARRDRQRN